MAQKGKPPKTPKQRALELADVERLTRRGWSPAQIAVELGISRRQVAWDIQHKLHPEWIKATKQPIEAVRGKLLGELAEVRHEAWEAWRRDIGTHTTRTKKAKQGKLGLAEQEASEKLEDANGNPAYLSAILSANKRESEIFGADAAQKHELTGADGKDIFTAMTEAAQSAVSILTSGLVPGAPPGGATGEACPPDDGAGGGAPV